MHFHQIGTQVKTEYRLNTPDFLSKTLELVLHLQQVLVVEVLLLVNKLIARQIPGCFAKKSEFVRVQSLIVLVSEVPEALEQFCLVEVRVFDLTHEIVDHLLQFVGHLTLEPGQKFIHLEHSALPFLLEGGWRIEPRQQVCNFLLIEIMLTAMPVNIFEAGNTGRALPFGAVLEDAEEFGSAGVFAHIYYDLLNEVLVSQ